MTPQRKQRCKTVLKAFVLGITALVIVGIAYEQIGKRLDRKRYPQIGRSVDIGGRTLNLFCSGQGSPVVIFDSGGHTAGYSWIAIQPEVAKVTRACWYDRAGYGWSDSGPSPRTFDAIANDLHSLLHAANISPPYVLVGATAAGFHIRVYNGLYPNDVAGAVLIHATDPDVFAHEPEYMKGNLGSLPPFLKKIACVALRPVMLDSGLLRLLGNPGSGRPFGVSDLNPEQQKELEFLSNNPETAQTEGEGCVLEKSMDEVRAAGSFSQHPLIILESSSPFQAPPGERYVQPTAALNDYWFHQLLPRLAALSTRGELVVSEGAERPDSIVRAVEEVVSEVRNQQLGR